MFDTQCLWQYIYREESSLAFCWNYSCITLCFVPKLNRADMISLSYTPFPHCCLWPRPSFLLPHPSDSAAVTFQPSYPCYPTRLTPPLSSSTPLPLSPHPSDSATILFDPSFPVPSHLTLLRSPSTFPLLLPRPRPTSPLFVECITQERLHFCFFIKILIEWDIHNR